MRRCFATRFAFVIALSASGLPACRADEGVLDAIFSCDVEKRDSQCGTDEDGKRMTCYVGSAQLGGEAFCTKSCDPAREPDSRFLCTSSGALLERCHPDENDVHCQSPLKCYRTDLLKDEGLCLLVPICPYGTGDALDASKCGFSHQRCAGDLIQELIEGTSLDGRLSTNNLHCVSLECSPGTCTGSTLRETCPLEFYALISGLPLVCAATCDRFACPPNFSCAKSASPDSPPACMPGLPGLRCTSPVDCIVGDCIDTGAGFSVCTLPAGCNNDEECIALLGSNPPFVCVENAPGAGRHCFSSVSFHGANCSESSDCSAELRCGSEACPPRDCFRDSPGLPPSDHGECRFSCEPGTPCPSFGGLPHACLEDGGCFPGSFAVPCSSSADCFANLTCETVPTDERSLGQSTEICTASCGTDDDCTSNPWIGNGYCVAVPDPVPGTAGYCRLAGQPGTPCARDTQCIFENCEIGVCGDPPG